MGQREVDTLRRGMASFGERGEIDASLFSDDFVMHQASSIVDTEGIFRGPEGIAEALQELAEAFKDLRFEPEKVVEAPDGRVLVVIRVRGRGRGSGLEVDNQIAWVWTMRDGKASRLQVYEEPSEALVAVGLTE